MEVHTSNHLVYYHLLITSRLQYYRRVLKEPISDDPKKIRQRERIQRKYDYNMKVRKLLNRAVANRYI